MEALCEILHNLLDRRDTNGHWTHDQFSQARRIAKTLGLDLGDLLAERDEIEAA